jgi:hypothetical protein
MEDLKSNKKICKPETDYKLEKKDINKLVNYATKVKPKIQEFKEETKNRIVAAFIAAFAFMIALAWRDLIKSIVDKIIATFKVNGHEFVSSIITASIITIICVIGIIIVSKWDPNKKK